MLHGRHFSYDNPECLFSHAGALGIFMSEFDVVFFLTSRHRQTALTRVLVQNILADRGFSRMHVCQSTGTGDYRVFNAQDSCVGQFSRFKPSTFQINGYFNIRDVSSCGFGTRPLDVSNKNDDTTSPYGYLLCNITYITLLRPRSRSVFILIE